MTPRERQRQAGLTYGPRNLPALQAWAACPINRAKRGRAISAGWKRRARKRQQADLPKHSPVRVRQNDGG